MSHDDPSAALAAFASDSLAARDAAALQLETAGWPAALQILGASRELPPSARARALFTFVALTYAEQARRIRRDAPVHTVALSGGIAQLASALAGICGLEIHCDPELRDRHGAIDLKDAPALQLLDALAATADAGWEQDAFGVVHLRPGRQPVYPALYVGDLRLRALLVSTQRDLDFTAEAPRLVARIRLEAQVERPLQPLAPLSLRVLGAADDDGATPQAELVQVEVQDHRATWDCVLVGLSPHARAAALHLAVTAIFPDTHEVASLVPRVGGRATVELCELEVTELREDGLTLTASRRADIPPVPRTMLLRAIDAAFLGISDTGEEIARVEISTNGGEDEALRWSLRWTRFTPLELRELRVRVARTLYVRTTPFELQGLALP